MQVSNTGRKTFKAGRVVAFSDGVMAVAATLLVLDLKLPEGVTDAQLGGVLSGSLHNLWVYVLSFVVVGLLWMGHHEQFSHIGRVDGLLIWLNLFYLLTIGLIPFLTSLLADHASALPTCLYASVLVLTSLLSAAMWWHASGDPVLMSKDIPERIRREGLLGPLLTGSVFALSIGIGLVWGATPAQWSWLLLIPVARLPAVLESRLQNN